MFGSKNRRQYIELTAKKISWGHWFVFFNSLWLIIIGSRYAFLIDWPDTLLGKIYFFVSLVGHFSFIVFAFYLLLLFPLSFLIKNERTYRGISVILATIGISLMLVDTEVFASFHLHLTSLVWNLVVNPENGELARQWQLFFAPMPLILLAQMVYSRWSWQKLRSLERQRWLKYVGIFYLVTFLAMHIMYAWADAVLYRPITMQKSNFPLSYPMTARTFLQRHGFLDKERLLAKAREQGRADALKIDYPKHALRFGNVQDTPNIIFINLTGWRKDSVTAALMPNLSAYLPKATQFDHHYSTGNDEVTGLFGLFYGLLPEYIDSVSQQKVMPILLTTLAKHHYQICRYYDEENKVALRRMLFSANHYDKLGAYSCEQSRPDFQKNLFHSPYFVFMDMQIPAGLSQEAYQQQIRNFDTKLGNIFKDIDWKNTLVILTAASGYEFQHESDKVDNQFSRMRIEVPMYVFWKGLPAMKVETLTSNLDVVPALMKHIFDVKNPASDYSQGQDLFNLKKNRDWVQSGDQKWNVIITPDDVQYHLNRKGDYEKFDAQGDPVSSSRPPLGLFLDVYKRAGNFWAH
ncbi:DUF3413 domain-containing protein [Actinobacillus delphinicola]|uniref:Sulfatase n=1 Tax=Actinobacillus delphinicola TaxID=51161 RepID=A0A448TSY0_9PAST|nr:DUF3413 domain-containing protein [Actinobacillus delphinicola]VEJ09026.1 sulfatase [Actinobacillus delphinicola]